MINVHYYKMLRDLNHIFDFLNNLDKTGDFEFYKLIFNFNVQ